MPPPYTVAPEELSEIFHEEIKDALFAQVSPVAEGEQPVAVLLGGQTAAGKSSAFSGILQRHGENMVEIRPDDFRQFHPRLDEIMEEDPHGFIEHTSQAMYAWSDMTRAYAHAHGYGMVIENTYTRPEYLTKYARELSEPATEVLPDDSLHTVHGGYQYEAVVVATPTERSCLDLVGRYLEDPPGEGRWSDAQFHDWAFDQLPRSVDVLEECPDVDRVIVTDREGSIHYDNSRSPDGDWLQEPGGAQALREARHEGQVPFDAPQSREWMGSYWHHNRELIERGELNNQTAPTMLRLHEHADHIAPVAYSGQDEQLREHRQHQTVQKAILLAGERGVPNTDLPPTPEAFLNASPHQQRGYLQTMHHVGTEEREGVPEDAADAARRSQQGQAPPGVRNTRADTPRRDGPQDQGRGPDLGR